MKGISVLIWLKGIFLNINVVLFRKIKLYVV